MKQKQKGFTLIELLVVIAIIGLLSTLAVVSLSAARSRARDAKRLADLRSVQNAVELYASDKGFYPKVWYIAGTYINEKDGACLDGAAPIQPFKSGISPDTCSSPLIVLKADQMDPIKYVFIYRSDEAGTKYVLYVKEENKIGACVLPEGITEGKTKEECNILAGF